jgi:hypothetical protein
MDAAPFESLLGVVAESRNIKLFNAFCQIAVEGPLESVLEIVDHDLLDISVYGVLPLFKIRLLGEEIMDQLAEPLIQVTRSIKTAYGSSVALPSPANLVLTARWNHLSSQS